MTLYEMTEQAQALYEMLQSEEIDEQVYADTLEAIGVDEKLLNYIAVMKNYEADKTSITAEIDRLQKKKKSAENAIERMKTAMYNFMKLSGQSKVKAGIFNLRINQSEAVRVTNESLIPKQYLKPQPDKIDKTAIKKAIKAGEEVNGADIEIRESVVVR